ncbi:hypothetical protein D9615_007967 [Tricholomella constricta]|uniref:Lysozyme n=1 Tax=Tricholomella constricta TaxID=117010 RepID=A0A8H5H2H9_9AGAR|nr:hypothetical protein D9615_007967 [Tricholomella constricta]
MIISLSVPTVLLLLSNTINAAPLLRLETRACIAGSDGRCITTGYKSPAVARELESPFGLSDVAAPAPSPAAPPAVAASAPVAANDNTTAAPDNTVATANALSTGNTAATTAVGACGAPGINDATVSLLKSFEGFVASPAPDPIGLPTVGFGHLCKSKGCAEVPFSFPLSQSTAAQLLQTDVGPFVKCINDAVSDSVVLNDNQLGALVSWSFNVGCSAAKGSTLVKRLNAGEAPNTVAAQELPRFNKAGGKVLGGLTRRRAAEAALWVDIGPGPGPGIFSVLEQIGSTDESLRVHNAAQADAAAAVLALRLDNDVHGFEGGAYAGHSVGRGLGGDGALVDCATVDAEGWVGGGGGERVLAVDWLDGYGGGMLDDVKQEEKALLILTSQHRHHSTSAHQNLFKHGMSMSDFVAAPPVLEVTSAAILKHRESWSKLNSTHVFEPSNNSAGSIAQPPQPAMEQKRAGSFYSYTPKTTSISFPWPQELTGLERIALSAKGDLQRVLSAFFARPISIALVYSNTYHHVSPHQPAVPLSLPNPSAIASVSCDLPVIQTRQVHLQCSGKIVCTATSTVRITSPECAHLFLEEKYAIGQMFARMGKAPEFDLMSVGLGPISDDDTPPSEKAPFGGRQVQQLWRKYKLIVADFECEILEVFPSRDMFVGGHQWLDADAAVQEWAMESFTTSTKDLYLPSRVLRPQTSLILFLGLAFLLMLAFEFSMFFTGESLFYNQC